MDAPHILALLGIGILAGAFGQLVRVIAGFEKERQRLADNAANGLPGQTLRSVWSGREFGLSMLVATLVGGTAGVIAVATGGVDPHAVPEGALATLLLAGYAGTDFIEAFVAKHYKR